MLLGPAWAKPRLKSYKINESNRLRQVLLALAMLDPVNGPYRPNKELTIGQGSGCPRGDNPATSATTWAAPVPLLPPC